MPSHFFLPFRRVWRGGANFFCECTLICQLTTDARIVSQSAPVGLGQSAKYLHFFQKIVQIQTFGIRVLAIGGNPKFGI